MHTLNKVEASHILAKMAGIFLNNGKQIRLSDMNKWIHLRLALRSCESRQ